MVCYNHWIAYEISDFDAEAVIREANLCAQTGIEYLVFDAGWAKGGFRGGNGDWIPDPLKIPMGLKALAQQVNACGVKFGLWLEPEFAWKGSQIVKDHPEWFIALDPGSLPEPQRWEADYCLMNFGLEEVRDYWINYFGWLHFDLGVEWVRWDFNQPVGAFWKSGDVSGGRGITQLAHVHGLYEVLDRILIQCPGLVLEQCAGGGTRVEPGIMRRGHLYWISDHSSSPDLCRYFQHGMNRLWPAQYANVNVVSREGNLSALGWHSHQCGSFGVSSRLNQWKSPEIAELKKQIARFKEFRSKLRGDFVAGSVPAKLRGDYSARSGEVLFTYDFDSQQSTIQY
ncbi:alpha-galactosidase [Kamptonema cortianum]|nr:alpha-galactosidase [Kamptonema cortianum]